MVKGRRVRTIETRNDDCCPSDPKRKHQKPVIVKEKTQTITQFFQTVVQMDYNDEKTEKYELIDDKCVLKETQVLGLNASKGSFEPRPEFKTPTTPHRIEYRMETPVISSNEQEQVVPFVSEKLPKGKKRLKACVETKLTEFFPVRRSIRKTKKTVLEEKQRSLEDALKTGNEEGLLVKFFDEKGRGVIASKVFEKGDFVVEYSGELIDIIEANKREQSYSQDHTTGCYMYYFKHKNQQYCIDATAESGRFGRLVNHSRNGNLVTRSVLVDNKPRLVLLAKDRILPGEEITYDYGDRSKESLKHHPWLAF